MDVVDRETVAHAGRFALLVLVRMRTEIIELMTIVCVMALSYWRLSYLGLGIPPLSGCSSDTAAEGDDCIETAKGQGVGDGYGVGGVGGAGFFNDDVYVQGRVGGGYSGGWREALFVER